MEYATPSTQMMEMGSDADETTNCNVSSYASTSDSTNGSLIPADMDSDGTCDALDNDIDGDSMQTHGTSARLTQAGTSTPTTTGSATATPIPMTMATLSTIQMTRSH